ncbi:MAG: hypothetical protein IJS62_02850 [Bacteroidales bacterium]|nr:hypothetical protein [Bacteroidales bacterium]
MKKILIILSVLCALPLCVNAQDTFSLKLDYGEVSLSEVLASFTEQTGVTFSFEKSLGDMVLPGVHVRLDAASMETCVAAVLAGTGIDSQISGRMVALTKPAKSSSQITPPIFPPALDGNRRRF